MTDGGCDGDCQRNGDWPYGDWPYGDRPYGDWRCKGDWAYEGDLQPPIELGEGASGESSARERTVGERSAGENGGGAVGDAVGVCGERSRMGAALQLEIGAPDDDLARDLMLSHAAQRGLAMGEGAPAYLVPRMERSYAAIEKIVAEIDRLSLERQVPATLSVWRDALEAVQGPDQARLI